MEAASQGHVPRQVVQLRPPGSLGDNMVASIVPTWEQTQLCYKAKQFSMVKITLKMLKLWPRPTGIHLGSGSKFHERPISISNGSQRCSRTLRACQHRILFP